MEGDRDRAGRDADEQVDVVLARRVSQRGNIHVRAVVWSDPEPTRARCPCAPIAAADASRASAGACGCPFAPAAAAGASRDGEGRDSVGWPLSAGAQLEKLWDECKLAPRSLTAAGRGAWPRRVDGEALTLIEPLAGCLACFGNPL